MNKKEREQLKLNNLLQECIAEQKAIGLNPVDGIEIYIQKDPISKYSCSRKSYGFSTIEKRTKRKVMLMRRKCFDKYPIHELKSLIHHELIHFNLKENGELTGHGSDWELYTNMSKKVYEAYGFNALETYMAECYKTKDSIPRYNCIVNCSRCGLKNYLFLEEDVEYNFLKRCPNCNKKIIIKKTSE